MAEYYLDHGAYASALGTTPSWGVPQDGDGSASAAAAAVAIASVAFASAPASGVVSICGVSVSTSGVIGAASADAAANALATNINATATQVAAGVAYGTPQLRNLVYARGPSGGAPAGTCQVMMRVGSATLNYASNTNCAVATTFSAAPTLVQFAGGSGGCWGWFLNTSAIGVASSIGALIYGLFAAKPMVSASAFGEYDIVNVRTGRNLTLTIGSNAWGATSARAAYANFVMDDGTVWSGDSPTGKLTMLWEAYGTTLTWAEANQYTTVKCRALGGLTVSLRHTAGYGLILAGAGASGNSFGFHLEKVAFVEIAGGNATQNYVIQTSAYPTRYEVSLVGCLFDFSAVQRTNLIFPFVTISPYAASTFNLIGNKFKYTLTGVGGAEISVPFLVLGNSSTPVGVNMRGNVFEAGIAADLVAFSQSSFTSCIGMSVLLENNKGIGLPKGAVGITASTSNPDTALVFLDQLAVGGAAKYETRAGYCEFNAGQPVLSSLSPDGTLWSWLAYWTNGTQSITPGRPFKVPASRVQSRLASAVRAWSIELLLDAVALAQMPTFGVIEVEYVTTGGIPVCDRFPVVLNASAATWTNIAAAPYNAWVARAVSGVTSQTVPLNSVLSVRLVLERSLSGGSTGAFALNPEVALS